MDAGGITNQETESRMSEAGLLNESWTDEFSNRLRAKVVRTNQKILIIGA